jgi:heme A synthase
MEILFELLLGLLELVLQNGLLIGPLHRFFCGYTFALALALVRFFLAK